MEPPYVDSVDWAKWHVVWVDERVVKKDHVDSNYKLAYDGFLSKVCILKALMDLRVWLKKLIDCLFV